MMVQNTVYNMPGWHLLIESIHKFDHNPDKCGILELKSSAYGVEVIESWRLANNRIKVLVKIHYEGHEPDIVNLHFTEKQLMFKSEMRKWIKNKNVKYQQKMIRKDFKKIAKLINKYKDHPEIKQILEDQG
jgi:hypothetical protein